MKRILILLITAALVTTCLSGCTRKNDDMESETLTIVTTIFPQYDFARQIVGDKAELIMLLKPGAESHSYEPTPQDIKAIQACDLFIYTGGENDVWVDDILSSMGDKKPDTLKLVDCVPTVTEEIVDGMEHEHAHEHEHEDETQGHEDETQGHEGETQGHEGEMDEHVWTSPKNAIEIVKEMTALIIEKDPEYAAIYTERSSNYITELEELDASFRELVDSAKRKTILFGDRFPFRYLADAYGLSYFAAFTGCSTETEASAATVAFLVNKVKDEEIPVVFTIELSSGKIADSICEATGAVKMTLYSCHNLTKEQMEAGESYLSLMGANVESLRTALN